MVPSDHPHQRRSPGRRWVLAVGLVVMAVLGGVRLLNGDDGDRRATDAKPRGATQAVAPATSYTSPPRSSGSGRRTEAQMRRFLDTVLRRVTGYWAVTAAHIGLDPPDVHHAWIRAGRSVATACDVRADSLDAFYCPADRTIYIGLTFARELWSGSAFLPGGVRRSGRARGDFAVSYVVAHEAAHAVGTQYDLRALGSERRVADYELGADCAAGLWANSMYKKGLVSPAQVEQAARTAEAVGDYVFDDPEHHGTPAQRRRAWTRGYRTGDLQACEDYFLPVGAGVG